MKNKLLLDKNKIISVLGREYQGLASIVSDKFGIINAMLERHELDEYDLYMYQCLSANTKDLFDLRREVSSGGLGVHEQRHEAMIGCLAEALERYCMSYIPKEKMLFCKRNEFDRKFNFNEYHTYSNEQYDNTPNFSNPLVDKIHWTKIYPINESQDYKYWPASLIYLPFELSKPVAETTSTGMAAGTTIENCIISGLLELIERDALMINFLQRLNPPEIRLDTIKGKNKNFIEKINQKYNIKIYKLYSDICVPIFLSFIWKKEKGKIHYGIGASANLDSDVAINKSLKECLFTYFYSKQIMDLKKNNPTEINALYEHFLYYQGDNFEKLLFKSKVEKYKKEKISFNDVINVLEKNGINVYYKDLTTEDIKATGIKVVKVIAPSLIDLNKSHIYPRLGAKRFFSVPKKLGLKYSEKLTEMPHPFP